MGKRVAVSSTGESLESPVDPRFGRCSYFIIFDENKGHRVVRNAGQALGNGAGIQAAQQILDLGVGAVVRRLGYLLEHYGLADASVLEPLRGMLTATYQRLDPLLPAEGAFLSRWRLQVNVTPEELDAVRLG